MQERIQQRGFPCGCALISVNQSQSAKLAARLSLFTRYNTSQYKCAFYDYFPNFVCLTEDFCPTLSSSSRRRFVPRLLLLPRPRHRSHLLPRPHHHHHQGLLGPQGHLLHSTRNIVIKRRIGSKYSINSIPNLIRVLLLVIIFQVFVLIVLNTIQIRHYGKKL